jgi:hypothetical protein
MKKNLLLITILIACGTSIFAQVPSYVPTTGLVGWWPFNGNANDESGNGYNGLITGATATQDRFGANNSAYSYNGLTDYIAVDYSFDFEFRTISCWFKPATLLGNWNSAGHIITMDDDALTYGMVSIKIEDSVLTLRAGGEATPFLDSLYQTNIWYNVVVVRNIVETKYYLNGNLIGSGISGGSGSTVNPNPYLVIGSGRVYTLQNFNGDIDEIGIWNRALTDCEIADLYNSQLGSLNSSSTQTQTSLDSYTWPVNGQTYTQSGTYTAVIPNAAGCDSTITLDLTLSFTGIDEQDNSTVLISPNPSSDYFMVSASEELIGESYSIIDLNGKKLKEGTLTQKEQKIEIGNLSEGMYLFKINNETEQTFRIVKN